MDDNSPTPVMARLVGEAIATLSELGVDARVLGEFAIKYPSRVAAVLGSEAQQAPTDLEKVVFEQVTRALRADKGMRVMPSNDGKRRINVLVQGRRTSLTITASLVQEANRLAGSNGAGRQMIEDLAQQAPAGVARSTWTEQQLHQRLLLLSSRNSTSGAMPTH